MLRIAQFVLKIVKLSDNIGGRADPNTYGIHPQLSLLVFITLKNGIHRGHAHGGLQKPGTQKTYIPIAYQLAFPIKKT